MGNQFVKELRKLTERITKLRSLRHLELYVCPTVIKPVVNVKGYDTKCSLTLLARRTGEYTQKEWECGTPAVPFPHRSRIAPLTITIIKAGTPWHETKEAADASTVNHSEAFQSDSGLPPT